MELISTIGTTIDIVKRLRDISKNIEEAEFKNLLADLSNELADLKLEAVSLKEKLALLQEENALLKKVAPTEEEKPSGVKFGCYQFSPDEGLYCTACWDSKRRKSLTSRFDEEFRICPVCNAAIGTG